MKTKIILINLFSIIFGILSPVLLYQIVCSNNNLKTLATIYVFIGYAISVFLCCISCRLSSKIEKSNLISFIQILTVLSTVGNVVYLVYISRGIF